MNDFDDLVIGAGMAGLSVAALLARTGRRVLVLEAHDTPGGYAHTFRMRDFRFCAQVHYIFGCGEGETIDHISPLTKRVASGHIELLAKGESPWDKARRRIMWRWHFWVVWAS